MVFSADLSAFVTEPPMLATESFQTFSALDFPFEIYFAAVPIWVGILS